MKKIVINISDTEYEKFRLEALMEKKDVSSIIKARIFDRAFSDEVEHAIEIWIGKELEKIIKD